MTRSFGDSECHEVGGIAIPELTEFNLNKNDKMIVLASDGIWEFLSNMEVAKIVYPFYSSNKAEQAAGNLVTAAFIRWKE